MVADVEKPALVGVDAGYGGHGRQLPVYVAGGKAVGVEDVFIGRDPCIGGTPLLDDRLVQATQQIVARAADRDAAVDGQRDDAGERDRAGGGRREFGGCQRQGAVSQVVAELAKQPQGAAERCRHEAQSRHRQQHAGHDREARVDRHGKRDRRRQRHSRERKSARQRRGHLLSGLARLAKHRVGHVGAQVQDTRNRGRQRGEHTAGERQQHESDLKGCWEPTRNAEVRKPGVL